MSNAFGTCCFWQAAHTVFANRLYKQFLASAPSRTELTEMYKSRPASTEYPNLLLS